MTSNPSIVNQTGILEVAMLNIKSGMTQDFEQNFNKAQQIISSAKGYQSHSLERCMEDDHKYILMVRWNTIEDHEIGFRKSVSYQDWKALLHHFYDPFPTVEHFTCLS